MFGNESGVSKSTIDDNSVQRGALVKLVVKGLQHIAVEANMVNLKNGEDDDFVILDAMELITKGVEELQKVVKNKKKDKQAAEGEQLCKETKEASGRVKDTTINDPQKQKTVHRSAVGKRSQGKEKRKVHFHLQ
ncbi:WD40 repeat-containing protein HOS15-like isoform X2 [Andrographis paniculata]|nr:WD40 repeat-containing protein HOS15-like isoform X2 [Andrographis paniculata]XP_051127119.1 WD40 repeat-containing protein HOS15-like isoform X2 [Andrographis paniculata]